MEEQDPQEQSEATEKPRSRKKVLIPVVVLVSVFFLTGGAVAVSESYHKDRIFHGVSIGPLEVGGMKKAEAKRLLENWQEQWFKEKVTYKAYDEQGNVLTTANFFPILVGEAQGDSHQYIWFDTEVMIERAFEQGRDASLIARVKNQADLYLHPVTLSADVHVDDEQLKQVLRAELADFETEPVNARLDVSGGYPAVVSEQAGNTFAYDAAVEQTRTSLRDMQKEPIAVRREQNKPAINTEQAKTAAKQFSAMPNAFPVQFTYEDPRIGFSRDWSLSWSTARSAVQVREREEGKVVLGLERQQLSPFFKSIEGIVNTESKNAKFEINEDKHVEQFQPAEKGYELSREKTVERLNAWLYQILYTDGQQTASPVRLAVQTIEPEVGTSDVNDLGISEVLGVGYSNFGGSPANRVHNIRVGADKLHGILIEPGEEFSLLDALKPFTVSAGYLPELVIKGDELKPEIGGGLCQIGSTTFRAAMNSGLEITQRRNHSLVVSYYNDPRNGNPGTDATIYNPAPDFRFKNDTGHHILIETEMNAHTGDLSFTFWGTSDGRDGYYSEPEVSRWIPTGPAEMVETTDLEPGQTQCQSRHPGAVASFTYTIERPDGEKDERDFTSHYRPLPTICLVGAEEESDGGDGEEASSGESGEEA